MSSKSPRRESSDAYGAEVEAPDWEAVARTELGLRVQEQGEKLNEEFYDVGERLMDGDAIGTDDLEALRAELRYKRTFVEENVTKASTHTPTDAVERLRALEWEMLQFFQLIAGEISQGRVNERQIEHRLEDLDDLRDDLGEILRCDDVQEDDDE